MLSTERRNKSQTEGHYGVEMVLAIREHVASELVQNIRASELACCKRAIRELVRSYGHMAHGPNKPIVYATMAFHEVRCR